MADYRLSGLAIKDLAEIADYTIATFGIEQARAYRDGLATAFEALAANPNIGRSADRLAPMLRRYTHTNRMKFFIW